MDSDRRREPVRCWIALLFLSLNYLLIDGLVRSYGLLYLEFLDVFGQGPFITGWVSTTFSISGAAISPLVGWMSDRFPLFVVLWLGAFLGGGALVACSFSPNLTTVIVLWGIFYGFSNTFTFVGTAAATSKLFPFNRTLAVGIMFAFGSLGAIVVPILYSYMLWFYALRGTVLISGGLLFHVAISATYMWMLSRKEADEERLKLKNANKNPEPPGTPCKNDDPQECDDVGVFTVGSRPDAPRDGFEDIVLEELGAPKTTEAPSSGDITNNNDNPMKSRCSCSLARRLCSLRYACALTFWFGLVFGFYGYLQYVPALVEERGYPGDMGSVLLSVCGAADLVGRLVMGFVANLNCTNMYLLLTVNLLTASLVLILTYVLPGLVLLGVSLGVLGLLAGGSSCLLAQVIVDAVGPELVGTGLGLANICFGAGLGLSPVINGAIRETAGTYKYAPFIAGAGLFLSASSIIIGNRSRLLDCCKTFMCRFKREKTKKSYDISQPVG